ncbi:multidrug efflux SMR transporter [Anaerovorax odorimutans]|uniref:Multidrug efflux SMR transporter n=1 Tax=Anaerovorax odorimutans TaxID=109327 RepID=A0ABT1RPV5_9FIRM|nr:multidrug efflux SMR transporter [Anaerovorax odorimutans]MCQ4637234.1 multidrug efflux SMR transporter [Anaerovorax odorimutans]
MPYVYLALAIVGELVGTAFLKYSEGFTKLVPSLITILAYGICFFLFSKALLNINLSIAYATWCGLGVVAASLLSVFIFKESLNAVGVVGIVFVLVGVVLLNLFSSSH